MTNQEIIVMTYEVYGNIRDIVTFTHVKNEDEDEVYTYSNDFTILTLTPEEYDKMITYYQELDYKLFYKVNQ